RGATAHAARAARGRPRTHPAGRHADRARSHPRQQARCGGGRHRARGRRRVGGRGVRQRRSRAAGGHGGEAPRACGRAPGGGPRPRLTDLHAGSALYPDLVSSGVPETRSVAGLARPVRVVRDRLGVPHLFGAERLDVYRALGWVMAGERLWQMDLLRRLGAGRVGEGLGGGFLPLDAIARTVGFPLAAGKAAEHLEGEVAATIGAFADGVSARITEGPLPPEFELLDYRPEPWTVVDSFCIEYFVGFALAMESLEPKLFLARALGQLGFERGSWLYPVPLPAGAARAQPL